MPPQVNFPVIPLNITVHLGSPDSYARNVTVGFADYVKNVASSEIYPTWPENAIRANIYAIISFALNRIYTEYYAEKGFDITNDTRYDQAYVEGREVFENISAIVDEVFNNYIVRQGSIQPLFAQFCNGTTSRCSGLSQWGTVDLANNGLTPFEILEYYYGNDISLVTNAPVEDISESYSGVPLKIGDTSNSVKIIQTELNRISRNYPAIPKIAEENGIFGTDTEAAVRAFQRIFNLTPNGIVDKSTWYRIKKYYIGVKGLGELVSEGITLEEAQIPFASKLTFGMQGDEIRILQYYLNVIGYFNPDLALLPINGIFDEQTQNAVIAFQNFYGVPATGDVGIETWEMLSTVYNDIVASLPEGYTLGKAKLYPGYFLTEGIENSDVTDLQTYLAAIGNVYPEIEAVPVTGYFGTQTRDAVVNFQRLFGLPQTGAVGPITWYYIAREYDSLL